MVQYVYEKYFKREISLFFITYLNFDHKIWANMDLNSEITPCPAGEEIAESGAKFLFLFTYLYKYHTIDVSSLICPADVYSFYTESHIIHRR